MAGVYHDALHGALSLRIYCGHLAPRLQLSAFDSLLRDLGEFATVLIEDAALMVTVATMRVAASGAAFVVQAVVPSAVSTGGGGGAVRVDPVVPVPSTVPSLGAAPLVPSMGVGVVPVVSPYAPSAAVDTASGVVHSLLPAGLWQA